MLGGSAPSPSWSSPPLARAARCRDGLPAAEDEEWGRAPSSEAACDGGPDPASPSDTGAEADEDFAAAAAPKRLRAVDDVASPEKGSSSIASTWEPPSAGPGAPVDLGEGEGFTRLPER